METHVRVANTVVTDLPSDMLGCHIIGYNRIKTDLDGTVVVGILLTEVYLPNGIEIEITEN
jgi:hypothetical protein